MKLVVSFYGMCLCVLHGKRGARASGASVLLLNGAAPPPANTKRVLSRPQLPYHHPLLFAPAKHVDLKRSSPRVPTPELMVDTEGLMTGKHHAWSLAGLDLTLGRGNGLTLFETAAADAASLRDPVDGRDKRAYLDWRRLPDLSRIAPGATLRPAFTTIGQHVLGIVRFTGGELRAAVPKDFGGVSTPWRFSDTFDQLITDRFEFHADLPGVEIDAAGPDRGRPQVVRLSGTTGTTVKLAVVHEATPADSRIHALALGPEAASRDLLPHYMAFYDAVRGKAVDALPQPRRSGTGSRAPVPVIEFPPCPPAVLPQPLD